ncbi:unnamed protein product, partial [Rotaria sp. Silwood2]
MYTTDEKPPVSPEIEMKSFPPHSTIVTTTSSK